MHLPPRVLRNPRRGTSLPDRRGDARIAEDGSGRTVGGSPAPCSRLHRGGFCGHRGERAWPAGPPSLGAGDAQRAEETVAPPPATGGGEFRLAGEVALDGLEVGG